MDLEATRRKSGHMDHLGTRDPEVVWAALTEALTSAGQGHREEWRV